MKKLFLFTALALASAFASALLIGCIDTTPATESASGVKQATVRVKPGVSGVTIEQKNIMDRIVADNTPGSIKHLYVISAYSGQVLIYSTVRGKVTSGGKRLTPTLVAAAYDEHVYNPLEGIPVSIGGRNLRTPEVLQDDGTYGYSMDYLYWWDTRGVYHQHYVTGGQILHISDQPLSVKSVVINMELGGE